MKLSKDRRMAGILEPVFAIRTDEDLGIGDTAGVRQMIDWCREHGLNIFQTLPINETSEHHSPYDAISSLAIEPATLAISPEIIPGLTPKMFHRIATPSRLKRLRSGSVRYGEVKALKRELLEAAFGGFCKKGAGLAPAFRRFMAENTDWLQDYALFRVLMEENGGKASWREWPAEQRSPSSAGAWATSLSRKQREAFDRKQLFFMYVQWLAYGQWQSVKHYGERKNVFLMGDIPFGVGLDSADTWANPDLFEAGWSGGAPPESFFKVDLFTAKWGQNWGIGVYNWDEMRRRGFRWWLQRVKNIGKSFHLCRIDHVLGFFRIYTFPWPPARNSEFAGLDRKRAAILTGGRLPGFKPQPDSTPAHRAVNQRQGEEALRAVARAAGGTVIVAEDLGVVPDYVRPTLASLRIPGYCIPSFERKRNGLYCDPREYRKLAVVQPATHDHAPLAAAWETWRKEKNQRELKAMVRYAGFRKEEIPGEFTDELREAYLRRVLESKCWLAVVMITDVFGLKIRFNTPGSVAAANWTERMPWTVRQMRQIPACRARAGRYATLARESGRSL